MNPEEHYRAAENLIVQAEEGYDLRTREPLSDATRQLISTLAVGHALLALRPAPTTVEVSPVAAQGAVVDAIRAELRNHPKADR